MNLLYYNSSPNGQIVQIAILTQRHFDAQDFFNIFAAKIEIVNSKASITYSNNNENTDTYSWLDVQKLANRCSRKAMYYGRKFFNGCFVYCMLDSLYVIICIILANYQTMLII